LLVSGGVILVTMLPDGHAHSWKVFGKDFCTGVVGACFYQCYLERYWSGFNRRQQAVSRVCL